MLPAISFTIYHFKIAQKFFLKEPQRIELFTYKGRYIYIYTYTHTKIYIRYIIYELTKILHSLLTYDPRYKRKNIKRNILKT